MIYTTYKELHEAIADAYSAGFEDGTECIINATSLDGYDPGCYADAVLAEVPEDEDELSHLGQFVQM